MSELFVSYYFLILLAAAGGGYLAIRLLSPRQAMPVGAPAFDYRDPYLIAALRGGPGAVIELAMVALIDRGLLRSDDPQFDERATVKATRPDAPEFASNAVERSLLETAGSSIGVRDIVAGPAVAAAAAGYAERLVKLGLTADRQAGANQRSLEVRCFLPAFLVVVFRVMMTPDWWFLFVLAGVITIGPAYYFARREGEARGVAMLRELADLFAGLVARAADLRRGRMVSDVMFCAATFGLWRLPAAEFPAAAFYSAEERRRRATPEGSSGCGSGSSGSSGCGSSDGGADGGGSGCGGGGGCGSD